MVWTLTDIVHAVSSWKFPVILHYYSLLFLRDLCWVMFCSHYICALGLMVISIISMLMTPNAVIWLLCPNAPWPNCCLYYIEQVANMMRINKLKMNEEMTEALPFATKQTTAFSHTFELLYRIAFINSAHF